eukprot:1793559-Amphidinium_carterae.1
MSSAAWTNFISEVLKKCCGCKSRGNDFESELQNPENNYCCTIVGDGEEIHSLFFGAPYRCYLRMQQHVSLNLGAALERRRELRHILNRSSEVEAMALYQHRARLRNHCATRRKQPRNAENPKI